LFLNLQGFVPFCQGLDAREVLLTLNQLLADLGDVLERRRAVVTTYLGGGFMALFREGGNAARAVDAGLELLAVLEDFNRPRELLGLRLLHARVGVATGPVCVGNIGTYGKMDFTAVGPAVHLAERLMRTGASEPGTVCVSQETHDLVSDRFNFRADQPRILELKNLGSRPAWDVAARRPDAAPSSRG
jgi:adenylate cyclase